MLKLCKIFACPNGTLGLHLSRAPWDPYPWVSGVQDGSNAYQAGVRSGDTVLELNGCDVLGQKIAELAAKIQNHWQRGGICVTVLIWRSKSDNNTINQQSLQKFARCLQHIAQLLECPVCLEVVKPPGWQCCNGHVLCNSCRGRTVKCPICRVTLGPRGRCLLADKLFTLLAESFPCDGVRNGKSSANCQKDYKDSQEAPILTANINSGQTTSASSSPSLDKLHQRKHLDGNTISEHLPKSVGVNNNNNQLTAVVNSPDSNIVVLKLNQKSRKKSDIAEHGSCHHHHHHYHQQARHHCRAHTHAHSPSHQSSPPLRIFHCPTGKSSCSLLHNNVTTTIIASNNSTRLDDLDEAAGAKMLDSIWSQDGSRKPKGEEKIETFGKFFTEWDMLSHLTQVHQISVAQHYTTFGQAVRLQFPNVNSIPCITIQSERTWNQNQQHPNQNLNKNKENFKNNVNVSVGGIFVPTDPYNEGGSNEKFQGHSLERRNKNSRTTNIPKNVHRPSMELFFVACLPLGDDDANSDQEEDDESRNKMNDVNADTTTRGDMPPSHCNADTAVSSPGLVGPPNIPAAIKSKSTMETTTGHLIQVHTPSTEFFTANLQSRVRVNVERSPASSRSLKGDAGTWCSSSSSSSSCSSSLASFSMSSSSSNRCCSNNAMTRQHAIFIWYFGSECDVKNFQTVIECKRTGLQWTGCVHPLTECWTSIQRRHQQSNQHQFLLLDPMPDGGDNFFDILIKTK